MAYIELLIFIAPILILYWIFSVNKSSKYVLYSWCSLLCILFVTGASVWSATDEVSQIGSALFLSSSIWLVGPFLLLASTKAWNHLVIIFTSLILGAISLFCCFFILASLNQIWGL